ncbi:glycoside hydrolase family 2 TIM barrel-domain containing protein [Mucilaginibacter sp. OK283]|uniref:glycoside hydrolase family 2 protein n=1 Tax=Mucilaginibacter sp. OK283 TaxID=1881049 RepID=UPI0008B2CCC1|nr:glycoside hydrolase family 2 TIM barrel-domain containing protein [Mucilaginibacter sp. OK283]SEO23196.1 Beta-galactosidase/beta-glucuronidase [Mucilaginibacter sp. OK283]
MKKILLPLLLILVCLDVFSQETIVKYLSGTDKDHTVPWDFYCTGGRKSGVWTKIAVPSNWELQGFGSYNYGHDKVKSNEQGLYKHDFFAGNLTGKKVYIVFEGSMTDTKVTINGKLAGPVHQGSFYQFKYDITGLIKPNAQNLLEVTVDKTSANSSVNDAERRNSDFWVFGGIYRPVYLEIVPETFIDRMAVNAKADGSFRLDVYAQNLKGDELIEAQVQNLNGQNVGKPFNAKANLAADHIELQANFAKPLLWSAEFPNLYQVVVTVKNKTGIIHRVKQKFGFRTVELRTNDGLYVNGAKIMMKGSDRHSFWPETGRTLSHGVHLMDVKLMKEMNMNAVRMSHYPPDRDFLDVCDSLGIYVLDELTGWQAKYDTVVGRKLVKELVVRDVNHPSILFWDNGNEGGFNRGLDNDYALYDPQKRTVIHPWEKFNGTDTKHYPDYNYMVNAAANGQEVFFPTEFMHGLYDGGAAAGLDDFWAQMIKHPHGAGGFIWAFLDEAVIRTDKNNTYDSDGNHAPDGIVGPHREKEGSFYAIKEIWSPVYINPQPIDAGFDGKIAVENRYAFTNLNQCSFKWKLVKFPSAQSKTTAAIVTATGLLKTIELKPGGKGTLNLTLPASWKKNDALYLTAYGPDKQELFTWSWAIGAPADIAGKIASSPAKSAIKTTETDKLLTIKCDGISYDFDKVTGYIQKVRKPAGAISLSGGPVLAGVSTQLKQFTHKADAGKYIVEADYQGVSSLHVTWTFVSGRPVKLEYQYAQQGDADFMGITFNYPEEKITGMKWLGRGPYRVWKNRLKGQQFGIWHKAYNNTITGETWGYPEFKGYHAEVNWVTIENKESPFTVYAADKNTYLQMLHPAREKDALSNNNVEPAFPEGSIGFLNAIAPIGTKFQPAKVMGPQSQTNHASGDKISGILWFDFIH